MEKMSALAKSRLARSLHKRLPFCKVKIAFKTYNRLKNYFSFKNIVAWDYFNVLGRESNHWLLEIKESLFIKRD